MFGFIFSYLSFFLIVFCLRVFFLRAINSMILSVFHWRVWWLILILWQPETNYPKKQLGFLCAFQKVKSPWKGNKVEYSRVVDGYRNKWSKKTARKHFFALIRVSKSEATMKRKQSRVVDGCFFCLKWHEVATSDSTGETKIASEQLW